jgi:hypothetical protein
LTSYRDNLPQIILNIFADALGRTVSPDADFFAAGGDSLAAETVLTQLSAQLSQDIPGWMLIDYPSAAALAMALRPPEADI